MTTAGGDKNEDRPIKKASAAEIAAKHLRDTDNSGIGYGDTMLLHEVADLLGIPHQGPATQRKVLARIEMSHKGVLEKRYFSRPGRGMKRLRRFWLPNADGEPSAVNLCCTPKPGDSTQGVADDRR